MALSNPLLRALPSQIDNKFNKKIESYNKINSIINIGFTLDKNYVLETMITVTSIMATQKNTTKIRFHFGVTNNFTVENMLKIYELKKRINNLTEFNFYYLKDAVIKMKIFILKEKHAQENSNFLHYYQMILKDLLY